MVKDASSTEPPPSTGGLSAKEIDRRLHEESWVHTASLRSFSCSIERKETSSTCRPAIASSKTRVASMEVNVDTAPATFHIRTERRLPPSLLARLILCPAHVPAPFDENSRFRFQAWHAITTLKVLARHLRLGYRLKSIERCGNGFRIDLTFESPTGRQRLDEVKSARELKEVHRIQAALYWRPGIDEMALSNGQIDVVLPTEYIEYVQAQAKATRDLLSKHPEIAETSFNPNPDVCPICANTRCPFLPKGRTDRGQTTQPCRGGD